MLKSQSQADDSADLQNCPGIRLSICFKPLIVQGSGSHLLWVEGRRFHMETTALDCSMPFLPLPLPPVYRGFCSSVLLTFLPHPGDNWGSGSTWGWQLSCSPTAETPEVLSYTVFQDGVCYSSTFLSVSRYEQFQKGHFWSKPIYPE